MNVILLISVTSPWKLVVPYPAIQKKCFWIFFWHLLTPESVWLLKGGRLRYEATRFLSSCWSHKSALVCSWPGACVLPPPSAPAELGMSHPQILYHSNSPKPCHSFDFLIPGCWQKMALERDLLSAVHSLSWKQKHVQCWTLQNSNTISELAGELMQAEPVVLTHIWVILP